MKKIEVNNVGYIEIPSCYRAAIKCFAIVGEGEKPGKYVVLDVADYGLSVWTHKQKHDLVQDVSAASRIPINEFLDECRKAITLVQGCLKELVPDGETAVPSGEVDAAEEGK